MPNREEIHSCAEQMLAATATTASPVTSASLDCQGFDSCHFNIHCGATLAAGLAYAINESDDNSTFTAAPATSVVDDAPTPAVSTTIRVAYVGNKRYAQIVVTPGGSSILTVTGHKGYAAKKPTANPA
jgi:hypothetical protein